MARFLNRGGLDDLSRHLAQVVVGLVDHDLTGGSIAPVEQIFDRLELSQRAEIAAMVTHPIDQPPGQRARWYTLVPGQIDELPLESVPRRQPFVLVEHLKRIARQPL